MRRLLLLFSVLLLATPLTAQTPAAPAAGTANVEVDPIRCWWRTSAGSVRIGETFDVSLTCAALDNEAVQVIPDESRLGSAVIQMAPFEVLSGSHPADLHSGSRRFFQYQYTLRIINPDVIGKDVRISDIVIHYRINSRVAASTAVQGRDLVYMLPAQVMRIASLVPAATPDIRDAQGEDFGTAEALGFRASALELAAMTAFALGALIAVLVLVRLARRSSKRVPGEERVISTGAIVGAAARELAAVQQLRGEQGWTEALVDRALAATRVIAGAAIGRPVSQRLAGDSLSGEGRLLVRRPLGGKPHIVSSPVTADEVSRAQRRAASGMVTESLDDLRDSLKTFAGAQYGRAGQPDEAALDTALQEALGAASRVRKRHTWLRSAVRQWRARPRTAESRA